MGKLSGSKVVKIVEKESIFMFCRTVFAVIIICGAVLQSDALAAEMNSEQEMFYELLLRLQEELTAQENSPLQNIHDFFTQACDYPSEDTADQRIVREEKEIIRRDMGLELRGGLSTKSISSDEVDDDDSQTQGGNVELSWKVLKDGYADHLLKTKQYHLLEQEVEILTALRELDRQYKCRSFSIKKNFSSLSMNILKLKLDLLEPVYSVERRAYFKQWSLLDDYLVSERDLVITRYDLDVLSKDPYLDDGLTLKAIPPMIRVDLAGVLEKVRNDKSFSQLFQLRKDLIRAEQDGLLDDSLRLYVRKNFDIGGGDEDADSVVAGLRFTIPLHTRVNDLEKAKLLKLEQKEKYLRWERVAECRAAYGELEEQLRRCIKQFYRHKQAGERVRQTLISLRQGEEYLMTTAVTRMKSLIDARLEMTRAVEELYRRVNQIFFVARIPYDSKLVQTVSLAPALKRARIGTRSVYIWSKDFNRFSNQDIAAFLEAKQISTVLLSAGQGTLPEKMDDFIRLVSGKNIAIELIVGDNTWIFKRKHFSAVERSLVAAEKTGRLHFDIEPQALEDYKQNKKVYTDLFQSLMGKIQKKLLDRSMTIAVPFHFNEDVYTALGRSSEKLYVMAYGTTEASVLIRRINNALNAVGPDKIVVALRASDFKDEWELEKMIGQINAATEIDGFAFHDLGDFLNLTKLANETEN